jgi:hypothetical protein
MSKNSSFSLSLVKRDANLECRVTTTPYNAMMLPLYRCRINQPLWKDISQSYKSLIRCAPRENSSAESFKRRLERIGIQLGTILQPIFDDFGLQTNEAYDITLILDKHTVKLPWELSILDNDMSSPLCLKMNSGRVMDIECGNGFECVHERKTRSTSKLALVVGNNYRYSRRTKPLGNAEKDAKLAAKILRQFGKDCNLAICGSRAITGKSIDPEKIVDHLVKGVDIFHFSGHGRMQGSFSQIYLTDRFKLPTSTVNRILEDTNAPAFSFINACETATQERSRWGVQNWAYTMACRGGQACIGTFWSVMDWDSTEFSRNFYKNLLEKNMKIGEAVRQARLKVRRSGDGTSIFTWPGFVLYGPAFLKHIDLFGY